MLHFLFTKKIIIKLLKIVHKPDMVPTPITRHSTRASRVNVGPKIAIPRAMFSLTSS